MMIRPYNDLISESSMRDSATHNRGNIFNKPRINGDHNNGSHQVKSSLQDELAFDSDERLSSNYMENQYFGNHSNNMMRESDAMYLSSLESPKISPLIDFHKILQQQESTFRGPVKGRKLIYDYEPGNVKANENITINPSLP